MKIAKIDSFTGYIPTEIIVTICCCKLYYFEIYKYCIVLYCIQVFIYLNTIQYNTDKFQNSIIKIV